MRSMSNFSCGRGIISGLAFLLLLAASSYADPITYTYTYTGMDFTSVSNFAGTGVPEFTTSDYVSASVTLDVAIASEGSLTNYSAHVLSYSVSAGSLTLTSANPGSPVVEFETASGAISDWAFDVSCSLSSGCTPPAGAKSAEIETDRMPGPFEDFADVYVPGVPMDVYNIGQNFSDAGSWSGPVESGGSVPEPATIALVIAAFPLLWRKKRC
jgi:hypothetical protein